MMVFGTVTVLGIHPCIASVFPTCFSCAVHILVVPLVPCVFPYHSASGPKTRKCFVGVPVELPNCSPNVPLALSTWPAWWTSTKLATLPWTSWRFGTNSFCYLLIMCSLFYFILAHTESLSLFVLKLLLILNEAYPFNNDLIRLSFFYVELRVLLNGSQVMEHKLECMFDWRESRSQEVQWIPTKSWIIGLGALNFLEVSGFMLCNAYKSSWFCKWLIWSSVRNILNIWFFGDPSEHLSQKVPIISLTPSFQLIPLLTS